MERTTPEAIDLQRTFREMLDAGDMACAMEVSSHALELHRADAIHFAAAIFTNLTQDHLDFHGTMEEYFAAKRRLFDRAAPARARGQRRRPVRRAAGRRAAGRAITFALERDGRPTARPTCGRSSRARTSRSHGPDGGRRAELAAARALQRLQRARGVRRGPRAGRPDRRPRPARSRPPARSRGALSPSTTARTFAVLVDYAHTPDSLENVLQAARGCSRRGPGGRLHVVFGCGGDRDRGKRPLMGEIAARLADRVIVTSDNPRSEDPEAIIEEILAGAGTRRRARRRPPQRDRRGDRAAPGRATWS